ncbi:hypothetical protein H9P43_002505 [Blastocladiella emersonii ATCC 22665]|nr:hypothetical protein H9P43_002505 [Blastocladiella emersonii ATCC 22665]
MYLTHRPIRSVAPRPHRAAALTFSLLLLLATILTHHPASAVRSLILTVRDDVSHTAALAAVADWQSRLPAPFRATLPPLPIAVSSWRGAVVKLDVPTDADALVGAAMGLARSVLGDWIDDVEHDAAVQALGVVRGRQDDQCIESQEPVVNWALARIAQPTLPLATAYTYPCPVNGSDAVVPTNYVLDTGIQINHTEFAPGRARWGATVLEGANDEDENGHGTFVAGLIGGTDFGVYKAAQLVAVRVLDANGTGSMSDVLKGLQWVVEQHKPGNVSIVNMSLGGTYSRSVNRAVDAATQAGVIVTVAAGNSGIDACLSSPASASSAITVGATDRQDNLASFSNRGRCVSLLAPGVEVTSSWIGASGKDARTASGTSFASPVVAGLIAMYANNGTLAPPNATDALLARWGRPPKVTRVRPQDSSEEDDAKELLRDRAVEDVVKIPRDIFSSFSPTPNLLAQVG